MEPKEKKSGGVKTPGKEMPNRNKHSNNTMKNKRSGPMPSDSMTKTKSMNIKY